MDDKKQEKRPSSRVTRKRKKARREILEAARTVLSEQGAVAVTLASVAASLGMTKQALYHYFSSKEALVRALVTALLDDEIERLIAAVQGEARNDKVLGQLIRAFYTHYVDKLDSFRMVYCQSQLYPRGGQTLDESTLRDEIHPRTRHLFDILEDRLAGVSPTAAERRRARQLAFTAWTSVLGLMTMLGVADATDDPVVHPHAALLTTLSEAFDRQASIGL